MAVAEQTPAPAWETNPELMPLWMVIRGALVDSQLHACPECGGSGEDEVFMCDVCDGRGNMLSGEQADGAAWEIALAVAKASPPAPAVAAADSPAARAPQSGGDLSDYEAGKRDGIAEGWRAGHDRGMHRGGSYAVMTIRTLARHIAEGRARAMDIPDEVHANAIAAASVAANATGTDLGLRDMPFGLWMAVGEAAYRAGFASIRSWYEVAAEPFSAGETPAPSVSGEGRADG